MPSPPADDERTRLTGASNTAAPPATASLGHNALEVGTRIGEFEIAGLVGEGGFGIVYLAHDHSLDRKVALKEYMPSELAHREPPGITVVVRSRRHAETFAAGLRSFINEARLLAQFDHPSLVKVYRFWEQNGTAYMVMPFYDGQTLKQALKERGGAPDEAWLTALLDELLDALDVIHARQCYHRDIAPDNILLLPGDTPLLLDFGAARRVIGDMTQALTVILKPGYAPIEQYAEVANLRQGAWTDLYALASVVYFAITGRPPVPAVARVMSDPLVPLAEVAAGRYSDTFLRGVDTALAVRPEDRPQDVAAFRHALGLPHREPAARYVPGAAASAAPVRHDDFDATRQITHAMLPAAPARSAPAAPRAPAAPPASDSARKEPRSGHTLYLAGGSALAVLLLAGYLLFIFLDDPLLPSSSTAQGTPTPGSTAPAAGSMAEISGKLAGFDCALLDATMRGDTAVVQGHVGGVADLKRIAAELGSVSGVQKVDYSAVRVYPRPYCSVVSALAPYAGAGQSAPSIALKGGGSTAYEGEKLVAEIVGPDFDSYLYADLYDPEGNVVHLLPNPRDAKNRLQAGQRLVLGDDPLFGMQWDVVPPFGKHLLVVMASRSRLFERDRPPVEDIFGYLRAVRENAPAKPADTPLTARYALIDVEPRK